VCAFQALAPGGEDGGSNLGCYESPRIFREAQWFCCKILWVSGNGIVLSRAATDDVRRR
jgi:hypothetical protein